MLITLRRAGKTRGRTIHRVAYCERIGNVIQYTLQEPEGGISDVKYINIEGGGQV